MKAHNDLQLYDMLCKRYSAADAYNSRDADVREWLANETDELGFEPEWIIVERETIGAESDLLRLQGWRTREELEREFLFGVLSGGESREL